MGFITKLCTTILGMIGILGSKSISACFWFLYEPELPKKAFDDDQK
ncbi:cyclic lactone autoinducer peptide [Bacillus alveayuensis]|nr:cyclic lactone autoinducer peptide [Bacillus alveayuensis]